MRVTAITIAPVKGMRLVDVPEIALEEAGARGDRAFHVRRPDGTIASTSRTTRLVRVVPRFAAEADVLELGFPDGTRVAGPVERGEPVDTAFYDGRLVPGRVVEGPFGPALSRFLGRPVQLVARDPQVRGGDDHPVTLMSRASLAAVGDHLQADGIDGRRFRMTLTIDGVEAFEEHGWAGQDLRLGDAVVRVAAPVVRCAVTTRDPEDGHRDLPVLKALAELRGKRDVTFGIWLDVVRPGIVRAGDALYR